MKVKINIYTYLEILATVCYVADFMGAAALLPFIVQSRKRPTKQFINKIKTLLFPLSKAKICFHFY